MKVLLISLNHETRPYPVFPLGLAYLVTRLQGRHEIRVLDLCCDEDLTRIGDPGFPPDVIGISVRNVDNLTYPLSESYVPYLQKVVAVCREKTDATIVLGGSGFSLFPEELLRCLGVTLGVVGEGERAFEHILTHLHDEARLRSAPNIVSLVDGVYRENPVELLRDYPRFPIPDRSAFQGVKYFSEGGMANVQTKRGCHFKCVYCTYPAIDGRTLRFREPRQIVDELEHLRETYDVRYVYFVDDIFNVPVEHASRLCDEMLRRGLDMQWTGFVNPAHADERLLEKMKAAGCEGIELGTDTGSPAMLRRMRKGFDAASIRKVARACHALDLPFCHYLIFGGPGETEATFQETLDLMDETDPTAVIAMLGVRIYPKTEMERIAREEGILDPGVSLLFPRFYISPRLDPEAALSSLERIGRERRNWVIPGLNLNVQHEVLRQMRLRYGHRGPLWTLLKHFGGRRRQDIHV